MVTQAWAGEASAAPNDAVEVLDGAALGDPSREPKPVPGALDVRLS